MLLSFWAVPAARLVGPRLGGVLPVGREVVGAYEFQQPLPGNREAPADANARDVAGADGVVRGPAPDPEELRGLVDVQGQPVVVHRNSSDAISRSTRP